MKGKKFDVIISWVTFCWLTDPIGSLEMIYNEFLAPGGIMLINAVRLDCDPDPEVCMERLQSLASVQREKGHIVECILDHTIGV